MKRLLNQFMRQPRQPEVIVVSGLPRSGTSMMMQMLDAGGVDVLTDHQRVADANNPRGYYEYERVKRLHQGDNLWLVDADGRAVKIVSTTLLHVPPMVDYRVIFMQRPLEAILRSQEAMRANLQADAIDLSELSREYDRHLFTVFQWLQRQANVLSLRVDYDRTLAQPRQTASRVAAFLERELDLDAMQRVVDPRLRHQSAAQAKRDP